MDDSELEKIRAKKRAELLKAMEKKQKEKEMEKSAEMKKKDLEMRKKQLIQQLLMPDALVYLGKIRQQNESLAIKIEETIMVMYVNHVIEEKLTLVDIKAVERRYTGQDSSIMVKRRGKDAKTLSEDLK
ncbi:DNA-binding protein [Candidatus Borrarchaeum sp.]|uniref:DNA-binding protein n=1 Tax=Candidatus Borrarchaeum sp. TaxID=2846742 RepID=UPI002580953A|nr:DNA-binding protein [Candidatus Borrarchaeum sp.]